MPRSFCYTAGTACRWSYYPPTVLHLPPILSLAAPAAVAAQVAHMARNALLPPPLTVAAGLPQTEHLRFFTGFVSSFDPRTRNPKWVLEYLDESCLSGEGTR